MSPLFPLSLHLSPLSRLKMPSLVSKSNSLSTTTIDPVDNKLRSEFDRDRQRQHKSHDARKRLSPNHPPTSVPNSPKRQGLTHRKRNSYTFEDSFDGSLFHFEDDFITEGKENSRPSSVVSVSLEDLVIIRSSPTKKAFSTQCTFTENKSDTLLISQSSPRTVSRTSISRQASSDTLMTPSQLPTPLLSLPPISELQPMLDPYHSDSESDDEDDLDNFDELFSLIDSAPGMDDWAPEEVVGGHRRLRSLTTTTTTVLVARAEW